MKLETYQESIKRINRKQYTLIAIAMILPLLPLLIIYFYGV